MKGAEEIDNRAAGHLLNIDKKKKKKKRKKKKKCEHNKKYEDSRILSECMTFFFVLIV